MATSYRELLYAHGIEAEVYHSFMDGVRQLPDILPGKIAKLLLDPVGRVIYLDYTSTDKRDHKMFHHRLSGILAEAVQPAP